MSIESNPETNPISVESSTQENRAHAMFSPTAFSVGLTLLFEEHQKGRDITTPLGIIKGVPQIDQDTSTNARPTTES